MRITEGAPKNQIKCNAGRYHIHGINVDVSTGNFFHSKLGTNNFFHWASETKYFFHRTLETDYFFQKNPSPPPNTKWSFP